MSSPVLSDLARFQSSTPTSTLSNTSIWNSVQAAVLKVFQGGALQPNELYVLNESIRWLLKTELGSFISEYFQNQLLGRGLGRILEKVQLYDGNSQLNILSEIWVPFFTETLPTLQAIFYPVQGQVLSVRQMVLLAFRDLVLLKLPLQNTLSAGASVPPAVLQMLLVLQGVHDPSAPSLQYFQLERLLEILVSPYLSSILRSSEQLQPAPGVAPDEAAGVASRPRILVSLHHCASDAASLPPLPETEGEAYLERAGALRRHTVANAHSDIQLLSASSRMHAGKQEEVEGAELR